MTKRMAEKELPLAWLGNRDYFIEYPAKEKAGVVLGHVLIGIGLIGLFVGMLALGGLISWFFGW